MTEQLKNFNHHTRPKSLTTNKFNRESNNNNGLVQLLNMIFTLEGIQETNPISQAPSLELLTQILPPKEHLRFINVIESRGLVPEVIITSLLTARGYKVKEVANIMALEVNDIRNYKNRAMRALLKTRQHTALNLALVVFTSGLYPTSLIDKTPELNKPINLNDLRSNDVKIIRLRSKGRSYQEIANTTYGFSGNLVKTRMLRITQQLGYTTPNRAATRVHMQERVL